MKKVLIALLLLLFCLNLAADVTYTISGYVRSVRYNGAREYSDYTEFAFEHDNGQLQTFKFNGHLPIWAGMRARIVYSHYDNPQTYKQAQIPDTLIELRRLK